MNEEQEMSPEVEVQVELFHKLLSDAEEAFGLTDMDEAIAREILSNTEALAARSKAKPILMSMTKVLNELNKGEDKSLKEWSPNSVLSPEQFNALNLKRKQLDNLLGALNANYPNGIRHDIHEI